MQSEITDRLPNTVTKCHTEIVKLRALAVDPDASADRIVELEAELSELKERLEEAEKESTELEARVDELEKNERPDAELAIQAFLDECERVGPLRYDVPQSDHAMRAIVGLHDAVGRTP